MFGVGERPVRITKAENALLAQANLTDGILAAQATLNSTLNPSYDNQTSAETRLHLARVLLGRALAQFQDSVD